MAVDAILRLKNTLIFQSLLKAEVAQGGEHSLSELCVKQVESVAPLLERVPEKMPEFTLHDPNHSAKVLELIAQVVPASTLSQLNVVELSILIMSAYLHDVGMTCTSAERDSVIATDVEFESLLLADEDRAASYKKAVDCNQYRTATRIEDQVFVEYLRQRHVRRSDEFIRERQSDFSWLNSPFGKWVRAVCWAHGEPVESLYDESAYPRDALVRNLRVNVQYLAVLLRLGDILDLDPERTPLALYDFVNPADPKSIEEWNKHRSVIGWDITPERVVFEAECTHPSYERALRTFIDWIDKERRDSLLLLGQRNDDISKKYALGLVHPVTADRVRSDGSYIYSSMRFEIDHKRVMALLGGVRLYGDSMLAIRELLQNSVDAVRHRFIDESVAGMEPAITLALGGDRLIVEDNGIGMDERIFREYFVQLGKSFYTSPGFRATLPIDPVSEFGIGALASFMVAKSLTIESRRQPDNPLKPSAPIQFEIPVAYDFFLQRPSERTEVGTTISLVLREECKLDFDRLCNTVRAIAPMLEYPVTVKDGSRQHVVPIKARLPATNSHWFVSQSFPAVGGGLDEVSGVVWVEKSRNYYHEPSLIVSQRGFLVGGFDGTDSSSPRIVHSLDQLLPDWTTARGVLDLRGKAKLTLTPDRRDAIRDSRFESLKEALDGVFVSAMRTRLEGDLIRIQSSEEFKGFVDDLLEHDVLTAGAYAGYQLSVDAKNLVLDFVFVETIQSNGQLAYLPLRDVASAPRMVLTSRDDWPLDVDPSDIRLAIDAVVEHEVPILIKPRRGTYNFELFVEHVFGEASGLCITEVPGVVVEVLEKGWFPDASFDGELEAVSSVVCTKSRPAFAHPAAPNMIQSLRYNAVHPLLEPFIDIDRQPRSDAAKQLIVRLDDALEELLGDIAESQPLLFRKVGGSSLPRNGTSANSLFRGVLLRIPELLEAIEKLFKQLWEEGQTAGLVDSKFPGFTSADLPWFWSEESASD